jgi:hypothetical protein
MIRCDTDKERRALVDLLWAVKDVVVTIKREKPEIKELARAFDALFKTGDDVLNDITVV